MRKSSRWTIAALVPVLAAAMVGIASQQAAAAASWNPAISDTNFERNPICAQVLYVGIRGSSEHSQFGTNESIIESAIEARTKTDMGDMIVQPVYVDYPASNALLPILGAADYQLYLRSIAAGVKALNKLLATSYDKCQGSQKVVLTGYSQGALVIDEVLHNYIHASTVIGVGLLGDPGNYPGKPQILTGKSPNPNGDGVFDVKTVRYETPASLGGVTWSVCSAGDLVCDYKVASKNARIDRLIHGIAVHVGYAGNKSLGSYYDPLADHISSLFDTRTTPSATPTPTAPPSDNVGVIPDPALKACVVAQLKTDFGITTDNPTSDQVAKLDRIDCFSGGNVKSLAGIENAAKLTDFEINGDPEALTDLGPLASDHALTIVNITNGAFTSVAAFSSSPNLIGLSLITTRLITDISVLSKNVRPPEIDVVCNLAEPAVRVGTTTPLPTVIGYAGTRIAPQFFNPRSPVRGTIAPDWNSVFWTTPASPDQIGYFDYPPIGGSAPSNFFVILHYPSVT